MENYFTVKKVFSELDVKLYYEIGYEFMTISNTFISFSRRLRRLNLITNPAGLAECQKSMIVLCFVFLLLLFFHFFLYIGRYQYSLWRHLQWHQCTSDTVSDNIKAHACYFDLYILAGFISVVQQLRTLIYNILLWVIS